MQSDIGIVMAAIDYIEAHLSEKLDLETVAEEVHYSKYYLHRIFTCTVGRTIHDYIQRRQLTEAANLLAFSHKPIIEIALMAGYESQQAFTSVFKAMYKKSPGQYRDHQIFYPLQLKYVVKEKPAVPEYARDWNKGIRPAEEADIPRWLELAETVVDGFPCLDQGQYRKQLQEYIHKNRAFILTDHEQAIGVMGLIPETGSIDFLGVHPQYRKMGIGRAFLQKAFLQMADHRDLSITTFRERDKADPGYRFILKKLGFREGELLVEFGYPTQRLILRKKDLEEKPDE